MCPDFDFFLKRLDVFMHTLDSKLRYMITIIIISQNDPFHHKAESKEDCVLIKEDMS